MNLKTIIVEHIIKRTKNFLGLDPSTIGDKIFENIINQRLDELSMNPAEYVLLIQTEEKEVEKICQMLLVSESWFCREMFPINQALGEISRYKNSLSVLSVPCARGEEMISVLAAALEFNFELDQIFIEGYDLSTNAIQQAKTFSFGQYSFRGVEPAFLVKYFYKHHEYFILRDQYRSPMSFEVANLVSPTWRPRLPKYDIILCRNLLIYLTEEARITVVNSLKRHMMQHSILILSSAESTLISDSSLSPISDCPTNFICQYLQTTRIDSSKNDLVPVVLPQIKSQVNYRPSSDFKELSGVNLVMELVNANALSDAFGLGLELLEQYPEDPQLHFALGVILMNGGNINEAKHWIVKTLTLDPDHEEALLYYHNLLEN